MSAQIARAEGGEKVRTDHDGALALLDLVPTPGQSFLPIVGDLEHALHPVPENPSINDHMGEGGQRGGIGKDRDGRETERKGGGRRARAHANVDVAFQAR